MPEKDITIKDNTFTNELGPRAAEVLIEIARACRSNAEAINTLAQHIDATGIKIEANSNDHSSDHSAPG